MSYLRKKRKTMLIAIVIFVAVCAFVFRGWFNNVKKADALAASNGDAILLYGKSGNTTPQWRTWADSTNTIGAESGTIAGATPLTMVTRTSPIKQEVVAGYIDSGGTLRVMCYDGTSWSNEWSVAVGGTGTTRRFDIAYETNSGDVMVLYSRNVPTTNELGFRTKAGSAGCGVANWSAATNFDPVRTSGVIQWVKMAWDRRGSSNLITAIWADANSGLSAAVWSGSTWGNEPATALATSLEVVATAQDVEDFDVEYESLSGDVMVVWGISIPANQNGVRYATCTGGTSACTWSSVLTPPTFLDDATNLDISANPSTDEIVFASIGNAQSDLQIGYWSGSAWTNTANVDTSANTPVVGGKLVSTGWLVNSGTARSVVVYNDSGGSGVITWYAGVGGTFARQSNFSPAPSDPTFGAPQKWYDLQMDPFNKSQLMFTLSDRFAALFAKKLVMTSAPAFTWTSADTGQSPLATLAQATVGDFSWAYWRRIPHITVSSSGTKNSPLAIPSDANYLGGAFTFVRDIGSIAVTQIKLTGTASISTNVSSVSIYYETGSCTFNGNETLFGSSTFNVSNPPTATITGTMSVSITQVCVYAVVNIAPGATDGYTLDITIANPATDIVVTGGNVEPATSVAISGTTTLRKPTFSQSAYRWYVNDNATTVTTALGPQDNSVTLATKDQPFRLRLLLHVGIAKDVKNAYNFKLQYASRSGTCDTGYVGESYSDVTNSSVIRFNNNSPNDGDPLTANAILDPIHGADSTVIQTYEELNNFSNPVNDILAGSDGEWDFALTSSGAPSYAVYCLRVVNAADGSPVGTTLLTLPEIRVAYVYVASGTYTSNAINLGAPRTFGVLEWSYSARRPSCTYPTCAVRLQLQTSIDGTTWTAWVGPNGVGDYYIDNMGGHGGAWMINVAHNGAQYIKYQATLSGDEANTPILEKVRINYK